METWLEVFASFQRYLRNIATIRLIIIRRIVGASQNGLYRYLAFCFNLWKFMIFYSVCLIPVMKMKRFFKVVRTMECFGWTIFWIITLVTYINLFYTFWIEESEGFAHVSDRFFDAVEILGEHIQLLIHMMIHNGLQMVLGNQGKKGKYKCGYESLLNGIVSFVRFRVSFKGWDLLRIFTFNKELYKNNRNKTKKIKKNI